jgi:hypothetical protein
MALFFCYAPIDGTASRQGTFRPEKPVVITVRRRMKKKGRKHRERYREKPWEYRLYSFSRSNVS